MRIKYGKFRITEIVLIGMVIMMMTGCTAQSSDRFLRSEDGKLVNGKGETVILRGVNLGGWLIQESWMCPVNGEDRKWANLDTLELLESRFTQDQVQKLLDTYQDNWITENDLKTIAALGCNVVRVPFWYRNFMKDELGTWLTENLDENPGIRRLDWVIEIAEKYDMYVILDMHGCPEGRHGSLLWNTLRKSAVHR